MYDDTDLLKCWGEGLLSLGQELMQEELMQREESELGHECVLNFTKFIKNRIVALSQNKPGKSLEFT